jgi:hypothetical protein
MKAVHGLTKSEFKTIADRAWEAEDTSFMINYLTNRISVCCNGAGCIYQFKESEIMEMGDVLLDGVTEYASEVKVVQINIAVILMGKAKEVDELVKSLGYTEKDMKPIMETPYGEFLRRK